MPDGEPLFQNSIVERTGLHYSSAETDCTGRYYRTAKNLVYKPLDTVCPRSGNPFYIATYYMKWVTTSWTYSTVCPESLAYFHIESSFVVLKNQLLPSIQK